MRARFCPINDEILHLTVGRMAVQTILVGIPLDYAGSRIPATLSAFRIGGPMSATTRMLL